jgi:hypothetical protein
LQATAASVRVDHAFNWQTRWSYREVLRQILAAGSTGIDADAIVLRVVAAAEHFDAVKVSLSRSSASGVTIG